MCMVLLLSESFSNLCLCFLTHVSAVSQQVQSVSPCHQWPSKDSAVSVRQVQVESAKKSKWQLVAILNSHENPALKHYTYINTVTAQWLHEAVHADFQTDKICNHWHVTLICSFSIEWEAYYCSIPYCCCCLNLRMDTIVESHVLLKITLWSSCSLYGVHAVRQLYIILSLFGGLRYQHSLNHVWNALWLPYD